ncbi:hypothetical protein NL676_010125 [Syzygium grande]|nr:hypothetical protein NL676_010125 [Syzygium grande]
MIGRRAYRGPAAEGPASGPAEEEVRKTPAFSLSLAELIKSLASKTGQGVEDSNDVDREFDFASLLGHPAKTTTRICLSLRRPFLQREACAISPPTPTPLHQASIVFQQHVRRWSSRDDPQILRDEEREV